MNRAMRRGIDGKTDGFNEIYVDTDYISIVRTVNG